MQKSVTITEVEQMVNDAIKNNCFKDVNRTLIEFQKWNGENPRVMCSIYFKNGNSIGVAEKNVDHLIASLILEFMKYEKVNNTQLSF